MLRNIYAFRRNHEEAGVLLHSKKMDSFFADIWIFEHDICINDLILQPEEVGDAMWASLKIIDEMLENGTMMAKASSYHIIKNSHLLNFGF